MLISLLFTIFGNLEDLSQAKPKLQATLGQVEKALEALAKVEGLGEVGRLMTTGEPSPAGRSPFHDRGIIYR